MTADTALRLARHFGTSGRFWLNLRARYDLGLPVPGRHQMAASVWGIVGMTLGVMVGTR